MTRWATTAVLTIALALGPAWTFAQTSSTPAADKAPATDKAPAKKSADKSADKGGAQNGKLASGDRKFVMDAAKGGLAEVELGKLASEKASNDGVKQFGKRMADDHAKANEELVKLAQDKGVTPPAALDGKHAKLRDRLAKLSGADFDRAYVDEMVRDHRKDVKDFRTAADKGKDPDVKSFASKSLPTLQEHLKEVEGLQSQVKAAKADKSADDKGAAVKVEKK